MALRCALIKRKKSNAQLNFFGPEKEQSGALLLLLSIIDGFVKSPCCPIFVIPAKAGIQGFL